VVDFTNTLPPQPASPHEPSAAANPGLGFGAVPGFDFAATPPGVTAGIAAEEEEDTNAFGAYTCTSLEWVAVPPRRTVVEGKGKKEGSKMYLLASFVNSDGVCSKSYSASSSHPSDILVQCVPSHAQGCTHIGLKI
jgi:hypothetical protein